MTILSATPKFHGSLQLRRTKESTLPVWSFRSSLLPHTPLPCLLSVAALTSRLSIEYGHLLKKMSTLPRLPYSAKREQAKATLRTVADAFTICGCMLARPAKKSATNERPEQTMFTFRLSQPPSYQLTISLFPTSIS
jgi:hypothetical protein